MDDLNLDQPLVSVVITTYTDPEGDGETAIAKLTRCLRSFINQAYPRLEILVCDDGSPPFIRDGLIDDPVRAVIEVIKEEAEGFDITIDYYYFTHEGQSATFNRAMGYTTGEYTLPFNDDDTIMQDFIAEAVLFLQQKEYGHFGFVYGDYFVTKNWRDIDQALPRPMAWDVELLKKEQICPVIGLYRSEIYEQCRWDESLKHNEDWDFLLRFARLSEAAYLVDMDSFVHYVGEETKSRKDPIPVAESTKLILERIEEGFYE